MKLSELNKKRVKSQKHMVKDMNQSLLAEETFGLPKPSLYKKSGKFDARLGVPGEKIVTSIDGEDETTNTVKENDVVVKGPKGELYVISKKKFNERYEVDKELTSSFQKYKATGLIRAYRNTGKSFVFMASWGEEMLCNEGDYLATPVSDAEQFTASEVYRIEKSVFNETYTKVDDINKNVAGESDDA